MDFKKKKAKQKRSCYTGEGSIHQKDITILNTYVQNPIE